MRPAGWVSGRANQVSGGGRWRHATARWVAIGTTMLLAACATALYEQAGQMSPTGSAFQRALYQAYLSLAATRYEQDRVADSDFYARKAIQAGEGMTVSPLPATVPASAGADMRGQVEDARRRLMAVFGAGAQEKMADLSARAQVAYDCWVHELGAVGAGGQAAQCRTQFLAHIGKLEEGLVPPPPEEARFTVYFGFDEWFLTAEALDVIATSIDAARAGGHTRILSEGHTDTSGPKAYNQGLSVRRAEVVKATMVEMGAVPDAIEVNGYGETRVAVETGDGVREPRNRRTEITLVP